MDEPIKNLYKELLLSSIRAVHAYQRTGKIPGVSNRGAIKQEYTLNLGVLREFADTEFLAAVGFSSPTKIGRAIKELLGKKARMAQDCRRGDPACA